MYSFDLALAQDDTLDHLIWLQIPPFSLAVIPISKIVTSCRKPHVPHESSNEFVTEDVINSRLRH